MPDQAKVDVDELLKRQPVYDGEGYSRESLQEMLDEYQRKHKANLTSLAELSEAHDALAKEMTRDLVDSKSAWEHVKNIAALRKVGSNMRGLLEKIPVLRDAIPERSIQDLLEEKIEVAQRRVQEVAAYLDTMHAQIDALQRDIHRLNKKVVVAAINEEKAARAVLDLEAGLKQVEAAIAALDANRSVELRQLQHKRDALRQMIWREGARLRLYSNAEDRIASIVNMNNKFQEILTNLHTNMQALYDTGSEVLDELRGNLGGLATAARASELTMGMQQAMESLKENVNKVATLASETSLYLTQNVERLTAEMKIYDTETQKLVESNLRAEQEIREQRIDDTIQMARVEYAHFEKARETPTG